MHEGLHVLLVIKGQIVSLCRLQKTDADKELTDEASSMDFTPLGKSGWQR